MSLLRIFAAATLALVLSTMALAQGPGGKGQINLSNATWKDPKTGKRVAVGDITVLYRFSSLLGEPLEKYAMKWTLPTNGSVRVKSMGSIRFEATVDSNGLPVGRIQFSPDIVPKPGGDFPPLNMAGSPSWSKFIINDSIDDFVVTGYLSAEKAKEAFKNGITLTDLKVVDVTATIIDEDEEKKKLAKLEERKKELEEKNKRLESLKKEVAAMEDGNDKLKEERVEEIRKQAFAEEQLKKEAEERRKKAEAERAKKEAEAEEKRKMDAAQKLARSESMEREVSKREKDSESSDSAKSTRNDKDLDYPDSFPESLPDKYNIRALMTEFEDEQRETLRRQGSYDSIVSRPTKPYSSIWAAPEGFALGDGFSEAQKLENRKNRYEASWPKYRSERREFMPAFEKWLKAKGKWNANVSAWLSSEYPDL